MMTRLVLLLGMMLAIAPSAVADVVPHPLFNDGAVLQRDREVPVWGTADEDEEITVTFGSQTKTTTAKDGKWQVKLDPLAANSEPQVLTISGKNTVEIENVLVGEVWLCSGQSNMQWPMSRAEPASAIATSTNANLRLITVPRVGAFDPQTTVEMAWTPCDPEHVGEFSAVAYFFGRDLEAALEVPIGLINTNYGGTPVEAWTSREGFAAMDVDLDVIQAEARANSARQYGVQMTAWANAIKQSKTDKSVKVPPMPRADGIVPKWPGVLYNAMIAPLVPYAIGGAIWYQGEANVGNFGLYQQRFPNMIADWRSKWGYDFPFLFVQLAPFHAKRTEPGWSAWAGLRESQRLTLANSPKTAMAVIIDVGEERDIHPKKKEPVGARLALGALAVAYGRDIEYSGPAYDHVEFKDGKAVLSFKHVGGGLVAKDGPLTGFTIAGEDEQFYNAEATIEGDTVIVSSDEVKEPVAVRYGWDDYPVVNLWNEAGLPASPFRTDAFEFKSPPKQ